MLKPLGIVAAAVLIASVTAGTGTGTPAHERERPTETAARAVLPERHALTSARSVAIAAPVITSISPAVLEPGGRATLSGSGFGSTMGANTVTVAGVPATVRSASATSLTVQLPLGGFTCQGERPVTVRVQAGGRWGEREHVLRAARRVELEPGGVATSADLRMAQCVELPQADAEYLVAIVNVPDRTQRSFMLKGAPGTVTVPAVVPVARDTGLVELPDEVATESAEAAEQAVDSVREAASEHMEHLEREREELRRIAASPRGSLLGRVAPGATKRVPREGELETMRIRKQWNSCAFVDSVSARVVFVGDHSIVMEDVDAPLAGRMNEDYRALGEEFEASMLGIITANFGNPLALDQELDGDGRVRMLFTPRVKRLNPRIVGFVTGCDFNEATGRYASSNVGEVFYATVPEDSAGRQRWFREARATVIHEVKHLASYAERFSRDADAEVGWLEEATAMATEELFARTFSGVEQRGNAGYAALKCEYPPEDTSCNRLPLSMGLHFNALSTYLTRHDTASMFDHGYGAGWSFVRWAADLSPQDESDFFSTLVRNAGRTEGENLARLMGRPLSELFVDWLLASMLDDLENYTPAYPERHSLRSWNMREIYGTLHRAGLARKAYPALPPTQDFGSFQLTVRGLPSATGRFIVVRGPQAATQLLWLRDANDRPLRDEPGLRLAIARLR